MNLEKFLETVINAVPEMGALIIVVWMFLKSQREDRNAFTESLQEVARADHAFQREMIKETTSTINRNSAALDKNSEALGRASDYLKVIRSNGN